MNGFKLTKVQKEAILRASDKNDFTFRSNPRTSKALDDKGIAKYTSGFGYRHGFLCELTPLGKEIRSELEKELSAAIT